MILEVRDVCAGYGTAPVLRNISFTQLHGEVLGVVGHNGMGKTTLLRTIVGLLQTASAQLSLMASPSSICPLTGAVPPVSVTFRRVTSGFLIYQSPKISSLLEL
jgi:ABC-type multidrug transport system ATPase subunit